MFVKTLKEGVALMLKPELLALTVGGACVFAWLVSRRRRSQLTQEQLSTRVVAITGCDSGVGFSAALHCHERGLTVAAMVLNPDSSGATALADLGKVSGRITVISVDVTKPEQVLSAVQHVENILKNKSNLVFHALMNNAGVMVFGETEWQTEKLISLQLDVNLTGAIRTTKQFSPLLRKYKGRVVNVSSHCATMPLPGLAVYAASKAGLQAWSDALRIELSKYGISVISLFPGAFFQQTNILSRQSQYAQEMRAGMSAEAVGFYGKYYTEYQQYLSGLGGERPAAVVQSQRLYNMLDSALLAKHPDTHLHDTPWTYSFYHWLAWISPIFIRDKIVSHFTAMPAFQK